MQFALIIIGKIAGYGGAGAKGGARRARGRAAPRQKKCSSL